MTIDQALRHPYVANFVNLSEEIEMDKIIEVPMDENTKFTIKDYREKLYNLIK